MSDQEDPISSPSDRSKRRLEDDESISKHDSNTQHNRAHKRQAVPDPRTDAPYAAKLSKLSQSKQTDEEDDKEAVIKFDDVEKDLETPGNEDEDEIEPTTETSAHISLRAIVSTKDAGVIIGKGGKNVSEIREQSGAKVTISEMVHGALERILSASGPLDAVALAFSLVSRKILQESPSSPEQDQIVTIRLLVPDNRMGSLIGKGGSVIKTIQEDSGARCNVPPERLPMCTERTIVITGVPDSIHIAVYKFGNILLEGNSNNTGLVLYKPQAQTTPTSSQPHFNPMMAGGQMGMGGAGFFYGHPGMTGFQAMAPAPTGAAMGGAMGPTQAQQILIPNDMVGCIIGKGGSKINEIRQMSGSHIKIAEPHGNNNERLVTITGTPECNQMALYMLYSRLENEKNRVGGMPSAWPGNPGTCNVNRMGREGHGPSLSSCPECYKLAVSPGIDHLSYTLKVYGKDEFQGLLLYVQDETNTTIGSFRAYDKDLYETVECPDAIEFDANHTIGHSSPVLKGWPVEFGWNAAEIQAASNVQPGDKLTVRGMVVIDYDHWDIFPEMSFVIQHPAAKEKLGNVDNIDYTMDYLYYTKQINVEDE
ncbi:hypothetical protein INT43_007483, partial [Umbelopsis isabellina]